MTGVRSTRVLTDQHVLPRTVALHSSCLSNWMHDPSWAAALGGCCSGGSDLSSPMSSLTYSHCCGFSARETCLNCRDKLKLKRNKLKLRSNCYALGWVRLTVVAIGARS